MNEEYQITVEDWINHLQWIIALFAEEARHNGNILIPIWSLVILSLLSLLTNILFWNFVIIILSLIGLIISVMLVRLIVKVRIKQYHVIQDFMILLNEILMRDKVTTRFIRYNYGRILKRHDLIFIYRSING